MNKVVITTNLQICDDLEREWDAKQAVQRVSSWASNDEGNIDFAKYGQAFFLVDPEATEKEKSYELPFADVIDGELRAVWGGVAASMDTVFNGKSGESGWEPIYDAVAKYYDKFDKESPDKTVQKQYIPAEFVEKDSNDGVFTAVASTPTTDRHGEIVSADGWDLANFKKNPVLLWSHDHKIPAIGRAEKVWVEGKGKSARLMFKGRWQTVTEQGRAIAQLVKDGILNSFSVGFKPFDMDGNTFTKQELLEISLVNVPANPEAMMLAYKSLKQSGFEDKTIKALGIPLEVIDKIATMEKDIAKLTQRVESLVAIKSAPEIESRKAINERLSMLKVIARASDKLLEGEKKYLPKVDRIDLAKVVKRSAELVIKTDLAKVR